MGWVTVTDEDDIYEATVSELFKNFRAGLLALVPVADRAKMNYRDVETHIDWERLAESVFDAFVRGPIDASRGVTGRELPLARYDIDLDDYLGVSWLAADGDLPYDTAMVRFLSDLALFDTVQVVAIDPTTLRAGERRMIALSETRPALYRRSESGGAAVVTRIQADE